MEGTGRRAMCPESAIEEVKALKARGIDIEPVEMASQSYVLVRKMDAPSPPWDRDTYEILIAIPAAYDDASLDGFYLGLPYSYNLGAHTRVNGGEIVHCDRIWKLVSWHYPEHRPWQRGLDNLETHITHCKGFFLHRGALNAP